MLININLPFNAFSAPSYDTNFQIMADCIIFNNLLKDLKDKNILWQKKVKLKLVNLKNCAMTSQRVINKAKKPVFYVYLFHLKIQ